jgi:4-amino-4-deoxy-L-arabinose transferase-like glycosyltransferase
MKASLLLLIPLALSAYTHLWNAAGFPDIFYDEGAYLRRAMNFLYHLELQESETYYDHPFFGQMVLAGFFAATGFPESISPAPTAASIESIHLVPKILMGLLAILDTFLVFKIAQTKYDASIALFAALLFAVMPITWMTRRVLLDALLLPLVLAAIYFALNLKTQNKGRKFYILSVLSGITLGLAMLTKVPAVAFLPLVGYLVYGGSSGIRKKNLAIWCIPVILIPILWPLHSISDGQFDAWVNSMFWHAQRSSEGSATVFLNFWRIDPVLLVLGFGGIGYSVLKRDFFLLLWSGPFILLLSLIGYVQYFHVVPLVPAFCVASAVLLVQIPRQVFCQSRAKIVANAAIAAITIFGLTMTTLLISTNMTSSQFEAASFVLWISNQDTTIIANPAYAWLYDFVLHMPYAMGDYREVLYSPIPRDNIVLVSEPHFRGSVEGEPRFQTLLNRTSSVQVFRGEVSSYDTTSYPYTSLSTTGQGELIDVRKDLAP